MDIYDALQTANNANPPSTWWLLDRNGIRLKTVGLPERPMKTWAAQTGNRFTGINRGFPYILGANGRADVHKRAPAIVGMVSGSRRSRPVMLTSEPTRGTQTATGNDWSETSKGRSWINSGFTGYDHRHRQHPV